MWFGPRGGDGDGLRCGRCVLRRRMVDSLMKTVCLSLLKGLMALTMDTRRRGGGDGVVYRGLRSMTIGSGERLSYRGPRRRPDIQHW
jgi:hypothetical protein